MSLDTDVLVIGAGMSGLGLAVQLVRKYGHRNFELIEKSNDVGGTWLANTYPGCGCDVASHFYSYSFALNPDWSQKYSMRGEIQAYFRSVAEQYNIVPHIRFHSTVESALWDAQTDTWNVTVKDQKTKQTYARRCKILVSAVGALSVPKTCEIPGADTFKGSLFHSAQWDNSFDWKDKEVVVIGNGCSATQFVPILTSGDKPVRKLTQFSRQAHYLAERTNPFYSSAFKALMRYMPFAMRLYRFKVYAEMENDFTGFDIEKGKGIREQLLREQHEYVKRMAPERYWEKLMLRTEVGCKRKVLDTGYLECLWKENMELVADDSVGEIMEEGVKTKNGRFVRADAVVLATGFATHQVLFPMKITGEKGISLNDHWNTHHSGAAQAYLGTCIPTFPNFFTLMGPNTVTGHLSVIYTVECQINFILRLIEPILKSLHPRQSLLSSINPIKFPSAPSTAVAVKPSAAARHSNWMQEKLSQLVWASGCTSWALDPDTGINIMMYPEYQFWFWWRSVFIPAEDFEFVNGRDGSKEHRVIGGWRTVKRIVFGTGALGLVAASVFGLREYGYLRDLDGSMRDVLDRGVARGRSLLK
ncbi:hypothetical protein LTR50_007409 [Elasticomyces elasticus]|nr:hypothetical protein LTR50_007409 [Elasticomyces elasticus]